MLDRSSKLDDSLMDAYRSIHEIHKGHAAGESDIEKQASQLASDIRYKAKGKIKDGMNAEDKKRIFLKLLASSPASGVVKSKAKRKLLGESVLINEIMPAADTATGGRGSAAAERTKNVKRVVRGVGRVARGVAGIANRKGTLSQKVTGAAIDAVKGRVGDVGSKVRKAAKNVDSWSKSDTPATSTSYRNKGAGTKDTASSKSATASSYKTKSEKKKTQQASTPQPQTSKSNSGKSSSGKTEFKSGPSKSETGLGTQARKNPEKFRQMMKDRMEEFSNWKLELLGEEGYDRMRDKHLERGGIGAVASKSPSRPYTRSEKQPKGDTNYQKEMRKKHGGKLPSAVDVVRAKIEKEHGKGAIMKNEETSAADKIINNIRSQRVDEGKLVHGPFGPYITGQKMPKEQREVPLKDVPYESLNGNRKSVGEEKKKGLDGKACWKGYKLAGTKKKNGRTVDNCVKVDEDAKMGRQSDEKLSSLQKQFSGMDQSTPSNQHMLKRVNREINKRKKQKSVEEEVTNEAKVDTVKHGVMDSPAKQQARNARKFGNQRFNQGGQTTLRRGLHWSQRGDKKVKGAKVEEEVGVSSSAAMAKAIQDAKLKSKEEAAVKKAKKVKNEEVALENRMASHTAGMSDAQKDSASNTISKGAAYKMGRRTDSAAFGDRKKSGKRGNPQQYRKSADSPEWEGRFPYGKSNIRQGKGSIKDLKNEYSPAVEKVIEAIKINKASPKSPNCIIMPKKEDIADKADGNGKKSTKAVVSKKHKQFFNQEGKTYKGFLKEYLSTLTKAAAGQAAKGAITTTAKTVGKETVKKTGGAIVKSGGSAVAKQTGGAIVKSGGGQLAKKGGGAIVKSGGGSVVKSGGGKLATKGGALAKVKKTGKEIVKQTPSALANRDKGGELAKPEPQKQGNKGKQSKGFNLPSLANRKAELHTMDAPLNPQ